MTQNPSCAHSVSAPPSTDRHQRNVTESSAKVTSWNCHFNPGLDAGCADLIEHQILNFLYTRYKIQSTEYGILH